MDSVEMGFSLGTAEGDFRERLLAGAEFLGLRLGESDIGRFEAYMRVLIEWNEKMNLTAITREEEIAVKHFLDSLMVLRGVAVPRDGSLVDVGSGAGFPGIPIGILRPDIRVWLIESTRKKTEFLRHVCGTVGVQAEVRWVRAEEAGRSREMRGRFDVAVARAVGKMPVIAEYCLPLCREGGWFVAMRGPDGAGEAQAGRHRWRMLGGSVEGVLEYDLPFGAGQRNLVVVRKVGSTPEEYPRRPGIPVKKPLW